MNYHMNAVVICTHPWWDIILDKNYNISYLKCKTKTVPYKIKYNKMHKLRAVLDDVIAVQAFGGTRGFDDIMAGAGLRGRCLRLLRGLGRTRLRCR